MVINKEKDGNLGVDLIPQSMKKWEMEAPDSESSGDGNCQSGKQSGLDQNEIGRDLMM